VRILLGVPAWLQSISCAWIIICVNVNQGLFAVLDLALSLASSFSIFMNMPVGHSGLSVYHRSTFAQAPDAHVSMPKSHVAILIDVL
jgi:hypothetical protein